MRRSQEPRKEFSLFRNKAQAWDPKNQRPEMWKLYNTKINKGESIRVFPISNWTEKDIWQYIQREKIDIVPLYFAAKDLLFTVTATLLWLMTIVFRSKRAKYPN